MMKMTPDVQNNIISTNCAWTKSTTIFFFSNKCHNKKYKYHPMLLLYKI